MDELQRAQRDYGAAFANMLRMANQCGLDHPTVERLLHAPSLERQAVLHGVDHMQGALEGAAAAFQRVIDAVHKVGVRAVA
jgi:hypothetical protein